MKIIAAVLLLFASHAWGADSSDASRPIERPAVIALAIEDQRNAAPGADNLMDVMWRNVPAIFIAKGYDIVTKDPAHDARVKVAVKEFSLDMEKKWWSTKEDYVAVFGIELKKGRKTLTKTYQANNNERKFKAPFKKTPGVDERIEASVREFLDQVAGDSELEQFLAQN